MPASEGWVCFYQQLPEVKWFADRDYTEPLIGLKCLRVVDPPTGMGAMDWWRFWKLLKALGSLPWEI